MQTLGANAAAPFHTRLGARGRWGAGSQESRQQRDPAAASTGRGCWLPPLAAASTSLCAVTTTYLYCVVAARGLRVLTEEEVLWRVGTVRWSLSLGPFSRSEGSAADRNQTRSGRAGPSAPGGLGEAQLPQPSSAVTLRLRCVGYLRDVTSRTRAEEEAWERSPCNAN